MNFFNKLFGEKPDIEGYEDIQSQIKQRKDFLDKIYNNTLDLYNLLSGFNYDCLELSQQFQKIDKKKEEIGIYSIINSIYNVQLQNSELNKNFLQKIINNIKEYRNIIENEISSYDKLKSINQDIKKEKENLKNFQTNYQNLSKQAETNIIKHLKECQEINPDLNKLLVSDFYQNLFKDLTYSASNAYKKYSSSHKNVNLLIDKFNQSKLSLLKYFQLINENSSNFFFNIAKMLSSFLKSICDEFKNDKDTLEKTEVANCPIDKLKEMTDNLDSFRRLEQKLPFRTYNTNIDPISSQNEKEFYLNATCIKVINKYIEDDIFPNFNQEIEFKNFKIKQLFQKLLQVKGDIDPKIYNQFLDMVKDPKTHKGVFILLSKFRGSCSCIQNIQFFNILGKSFINFLDEAQKKDILFDNVKNIIILSQTYYCLKDNKTKFYIIDFIRGHKLMKNPNFWREFISIMIKEEISRFEKMHSDYGINIEQKLNISKNIRQKLNEIIFSQLLTYVNNMIEFELDKRLVLKIADEFIQQYEYLDQNSINAIYNLITQEKDSIDELRKGYSMELEKPLIQENMIKEDYFKKVQEEKKDEKIEDNKEGKNNNIEKEEKNGKEEENKEIKEKDKNNGEEKKKDNEENKE